jgi:predicted permease
MRRLFLKLLRRRHLEQDLEAELAFHRDLSARHGNPVGLGNPAVLKEEAFDLWRFNFIENLWRDIVYGARALRRSPALVFSALLSLALGIGVNATMFSLGVEFLMSEPSVRDRSSIVALRIGGGSHAEPRTIDFLRESGIFTDIVGHNEEVHLNWNNGMETRRTFGFVTSKNYFQVLGIPVAHGRGYLASDPDEVAVLHHGFWRRHFNADPEVIGRPVTLEGRVYTIIGVLPENHRTLVGFGFSPDVYLPSFAALSDTRLAMFARLKPGMAFGQAHAAYRTAGARLDAAPPSRHWDPKNHEMEPVGSMFSQRKKMLVAGVFFAALLGVAGLVLLIACFNVASLLLARASVRRRELAIRLSLGAGRARLMQQLLVESLLLSTAGTALGLVLAHLAARLLASIQLPLPFPIRLQIEPDGRVLMYAALLTVFATIACGLLPAWQSVRDSISSNLHRENRFHLRRVLVASQIAVSVVVLATGFLFIRNLLQSTALSPGFDVRQTVRADVHLPREKFRDAAAVTLFADRATAALESLPGVEVAAAAHLLPFTGGNRHGGEISFPDNGDKQRVQYAWNAVTPGYFQAMQIPLRMGRDFTPADRGQVKVVVVNTTFVERYLGGRNPIGTVFHLGGQGSDPRHIIAVVDGTKTMTIGEDQQPQLYIPFAEVQSDFTRVQLVLRSATPPVAQLAAVRQALRHIDPNAGVEVSTLYSSIGMAFLPSQIGAALLGSTGLLGLLLAGVGLCGTMLFSVARRTREIGVRMAIGASSFDIARMVIGEALWLVATGSAIGTFVAYFVTKPLAMFLVPGIKPADPLSLAAVLLFLAASGIAAAWEPTRRALKIDPMTSLRYE